ncbi:MAG: hypothetical protein IJU19_01800 [Bacteroidales bacterium]|nr:hypothetical protein [Bacteroidales bacterium]
MGGGGGGYEVGEAAFVYAINNSNYEVHLQLQDMDLENKIVYVHAINCDRAIFGDLVSKYILLYKKARAIVVNGMLRDAHRLVKERYPIWCTGVTPIGCFNHPSGESDAHLLEGDIEQLREKYDHSIMVCDDSGVVMIPREKIDETLIRKLHFIETQEDVWYYCMDTLKMSTFEIVCQKKYLHEGSQISDELRRQLNEYSE